MDSKKAKLRTIAHARSGDKGSDVNIGVIATSEENYSILERSLTSETMKSLFKTVCVGDVIRYELPNLLALNFLLKGALGKSGGSASLRSDSQGKAFAEVLLDMEIVLRNF